MEWFGVLLLPSFQMIMLDVYNFDSFHLELIPKMARGYAFLKGQEFDFLEVTYYISYSCICFGAPNKSSYPWKTPYRLIEVVSVHKCCRWTEELEFT